MEDEMPILDAMVPHMEKFYAVDEDSINIDDEGVTSIEATTTSAPTLHKRDYKGINIGVDDDDMILMTLSNVPLRWDSK
jgi:hypothetical protein